jgi:hypothetical protein
MYGVRVAFASGPQKSGADVTLPQLWKRNRLPRKMARSAGD